MTDSAPFQQAIGHLEDAIARLEAIAHAPPVDERLAALEARHGKLRDGASAVLERLDRLIGAATPPSDGG